MWHVNTTRSLRCKRRLQRDHWKPLAFTPDDLSPNSRGSHGLQVIARLKPALALVAVRADMQALTARIIAANPQYDYKRANYAVQLRTRPTEPHQKIELRTRAITSQMRPTAAVDRERVGPVRAVGAVHAVRGARAVVLNFGIPSDVSQQQARPCAQRT